MIQVRILGQVEDAAASTAAWIGCRIENPGHARMNQRSCTHGARFQRDVEGRVQQPIISERRARSAQNEYLRVCARVVQRNRRVTRFGEHDAVRADEHGPHRYLTRVSGAPSEDQRTFHEARVGLALVRTSYSHSMVAGGLVEMS